MKKVLAIFLGVIFMLMGVGCGKVSDKKLFSKFNEVAKTYADRGFELNELVRKNYWLDESLYAYHYYPNIDDSQNGKNDTAFAWPYTEMVAASWRMRTLTKKSKVLTDYYKNTLAGFEYYRAMRDDYTCYTAVRANQEGWGGGDTYYDDNVWIAREFLNAFEIFNDYKYLNLSKEVIEYIWSGWANDEIGGIYWLEQKKESRNTCSNAPTIILMSRMYKLTKEQKYLDRAKQIYNFCVNYLRDPSDNVYWDNISNSGVVTDWKFTYNSGSMISAGVILHEITGEEKYLTDAKKTALGSYNHFFRKNDTLGFKQITGNNPWFNVLLLDGFVELYKYDKEKTYEYINAYEKTICYAYDNYKSPDGFIASDWVNGFKKEGDNINYFGLSILDMSANAENFGLLAHFYQDIK